jgi:hypothetical protein
MSGDPVNVRDDDLVVRLRRQAIAASRASKMVAEDKSLRNQAAGDEGACYMGAEPNETVEWEAAARIEALERDFKSASGERQKYEDEARAGRKRIEALEAALRQAKQYVHDSACDTDEADTVEHRDALMSRIDALTGGHHAQD